MTDTQSERNDLVSFSHLVQELIHGSVRRHTFTQLELELLFDLGNSRIRKSSRPETLRRYLRTMQAQMASGGEFLRLAGFLEKESSARSAAGNPASTVIQQVAALPQAG